MAEGQKMKKCLVLADIIRLTRPPEYTILLLVVCWRKFPSRRRRLIIGLMVVSNSIEANDICFVAQMQ